MTMRALALGLTLGLSACASGAPAGTPDVQAPALVELSGLAVSHADDTLLWAHNDSGDGPNLFRVGFDGADLGRVRIDGAKAVDWEDIATFDWQGAPAILVGDVGDNFARRDHVTLYAVADGGRLGDTHLLWKLDLRYPDGPRDCEAVAVDPVDGMILLLSKRDLPNRLYAVPMPAVAPPPDAPPLVPRFLGTVETLPQPTLDELPNAPFFGMLSGLPTALDISRDGRFAVVTTYGDAYRYVRRAGEPWIATFARTPERIRLPRLRQTEAGAITADGRSLFVSTEGRPAPLVRVPLPALPAP